MTPEQRAELAKIDLHPAKESEKRTDELLRAMLSTPPDPKTAPKKKSAKPKK